SEIGVKTVGRRIPTYCTSLGKAMLACLGDQEIRNIVRVQVLRPYTANTVKTLSQLLTDLRAVRKRGYAVGNEEIEIGLRCVGAPIKDYSSAMVVRSAWQLRRLVWRVQRFPRSAGSWSRRPKKFLKSSVTKTPSKQKHSENGVLTVEGLTQKQIEQEARQLYQAEKDKRVLRPFTERYPKIAPEESYRIQLALIEMKKADGAKVVGKKIGLTSKAMQKMLNVDQPDYGHILDNMVLQD